MDKNILQRGAFPFGPEPGEADIKLFNDIKPSELNGYLPPLETVAERRSRDPRGLGGKELKTFWAEIYSTDLSLADLYPFRVAAAWRIVRAWAVQIGVVEAANTPLREACDVAPSPWTNRRLHFGSRTPRDSVIATHIKDAKGLCFLPPGIPEKAIGDKAYTPQRDAKLRYWCALVDYIGNSRLALGTTQNGRLGLAGLTDPNMARLAMPTPAEICAHEELLVRLALMKMVEDSNTAAMGFLREKYGLFDHEVQQIMAMALASSVSYSPDDPAATRALLSMRLEKVLHDCHERMDSRGAILAIREMARLANLNRETDDSGIDGMVRAAQLVNSQKNPKKALPPPPIS